ncbi:hypothetical protein, partial [Avibacterium paragallinarum]|uniref:hypothetical protein n=1 Tax=Avibacterium paragallinarum TaxID=728 RepID=UPI00406C00B9
MPDSTAQHSTAQHSTAQHSTAQHSTAQHSTAQPISNTHRRTYDTLAKLICHLYLEISIRITK